MGEFDSERSEVRDAFLEGMDGLFKLLFTETVQLCMMDTSKTITNIYGETETKVYLAPYLVSASVHLSREHGEDEVQTTQQSCTFVVPTQELITNKVPRSTSADLEALKRALFKYGEFLFLVDEVLPKSMVADEYLFYEFKCTTEDKDMYDKYVIPTSVITHGN